MKAFQSLGRYFSRLVGSEDSDAGKQSMAQQFASRAPTTPKQEPPLDTEMFTLTYAPPNESRDPRNANRNSLLVKHPESVELLDISDELSRQGAFMQALGSQCLIRLPGEKRPYMVKGTEAEVRESMSQGKPPACGFDDVSNSLAQLGSKKVADFIGFKGQVSPTIDVKDAFRL